MNRHGKSGSWRFLQQVGVAEQVLRRNGAAKQVLRQVYDGVMITMMNMFMLKFNEFPAYTTTVFALGNSNAVRLPKRLMEALSFSPNDKVELFAGEDGSIIIKKAVPGKYRTLKDRFAGYTGDYQPAEWDTGESVGKETL